MIYDISMNRYRLVCSLNYRELTVPVFAFHKHKMLVAFDTKPSSNLGTPGSHIPAGSLNWVWRSQKQTSQNDRRRFVFVLRLYSYFILRYITLLSQNVTINHATQSFIIPYLRGNLRIYLTVYLIHRVVSIYLYTFN